MKKRVLLINPPYPVAEGPSPSFGLMSLAAYLLENGYEVIIEDYIVNPYSEARAKKTVSNFAPHVIGATAVTMNVHAALEILKTYRRFSPAAAIMMGGPHVTFDAQAILADNDFVDFVVRGEGELTCLALIQNLENKKAFGDIAGLSFKKEGAVVHNPKRGFIQDIDVLPYPARQLVQLSKYKALGLSVSLLTSRGCPFECIFCVGSKMVGRKVRYFDTKRVVDEFEMLSEMGFKQINIVDDLFTSNKKRCIAICEEIMRRGIKHPWTAFARVDTVSEDLLAVMKAAGCTMLCFGVESGVQEILNKIKKKTTLEKIEKAVRICKQAGIEPMASYIMGLPGETKKTIQQTQDFAAGLCDNYGFHILAPFPGTEVREKADQYGLKILSNDWRKYDANQAVCQSAWLAPHEIDQVVNDFNREADQKLHDIIEKEKAGAAISTEKQARLNSLNSLVFNLHLIDKELVEKFGQQNQNGTGLNGFIQFVTQKSKFGSEQVTKEVKRLFDLDCLKNSTKDNKTNLSWV